MKNTFGQNITLTLFGESHGAAVGTVLDGLAPGLPVDGENIARLLSLRRPSGRISTSRRETDEFEIVSGVYQGHTTGTPLCILIPNRDTDSSSYLENRGLARPGHGDYTAYCKYHGFEDFRGGGHMSGRLTAPLVAAGGILLPALERKGIRIGTHISRCASVCDRAFEDCSADFSLLENASFPVLSEAAGEEMRRLILQAGEKGDSLGGMLETAVIGLPAGLGEPWFDSVEGLLSHALFSVPAVKGIEFGDGFALARMTGTFANDALREENGTVTTLTNHNGGINGGITNGMPLIFRLVLKPTPSVASSQQTVNFLTGENAEISVRGRHDPFLAHRARWAVDSLTALVLADLLTGRFGTEWWTEEIGG